MGGWRTRSRNGDVSYKADQAIVRSDHRVVSTYIDDGSNSGYQDVVLLVLQSVNGNLGRVVKTFFIY